MAISRDTLKEILFDQFSKFGAKPLGVEREVLPSILSALDNKLITVVTGLRRVGKSTLTCQVAAKIGLDKVYALNFEDERLLDFQARDFSQLHQLLIELFGERKIFIIDEIQNITGWESFVRRLSDEGFKFIVTGSNARLHSREFGTKLTGRSHQIVVFPFSFKEFLTFNKIELPQHLPTVVKAQMLSSLSRYLEDGGIPLRLEYPQLEILRDLFNDVIYRDVIAHHDIAADRTVRDLALYLVSNPATLQQYSKLKQMLHLGSLNTVKNYISHLENAWLFFTVPLFSSSLKQQQLAPKKFLAIDTGFTKLFAPRYSSLVGRNFENLVYLALKRRYSEIKYYMTSAGEEVDFYVHRDRLFVQACYDLSSEETRERELDTLTHALEENPHDHGIVVSFDSIPEEITSHPRIEVVDALKFLLST